MNKTVEQNREYKKTDVQKRPLSFKEASAISTLSKSCIIIAKKLDEQQKLHSNSVKCKETDAESSPSQ